MVDLTFTSDLVNSMLDVTGSMQRLTDELDRLSLHSASGHFSGKDERGFRGKWMNDGSSVSGIDDSASESQSRTSHVSSKFDSAFVSQTDNESVHSHLMGQPLVVSQPPLPLQGDQGEGSRERRRHSHRDHGSRKSSHHDSRSRRRRKRKHQTAHYDDTTPSPQRPTHREHKHTSIPMSYSMRAPVLPHAVDRLRRGGSTRSTSSTDSVKSTSSSRILALGLSREDVREMTQRSPPPTSSSTQVQYPEVVHIHAEVHDDADSTTDVNSTSEGSTPIIQRRFQNELFTHSEVNSSFQPGDNSPRKPDIVVIDPLSTHSSSEQLHINDETDRVQATSDQSQDKHSTPHHASRLLPKRYVSFQSSDAPRKRNPPKRSASILQRLRRRSRSFKTALERRPKRRVPVRRSLSERITYHIKKGWIEYDKDLKFISSPSYPRPVGRMIDRKAGSVHIVQLYRPPSGKYGIYISQNGPKRGIYVSRFADSNSAKFYSGLISPGDEIIKVNGEPVRDKSVDYVYDMLAALDSVVFTVIPITARPDW